MAITRTDGTKLINKVFSELDTARAHYSNEGFDFIPGMKELRDAVTIIMKLRKTSDYNYWLNNLDISEYEKYFKKVTELASIFSSKQASKMQSSDFLKLRDLASAFGKTSKYEKRLEIINTFSLDDLQNWDKDYPEKEGLLIQLLDKWFMNDDGKDTINKFLSSFSQRDKEKFIEKTITNPEILELLLKKINMGDEKNNLLKTFIDFGNNTNIDKNEYEIPKGKVFNASFVDKKMYLNLMKPVPGEDNVYELDKQIQLQTPFTNVSFYYGDDNRITIPAISLIGRNYDDILYDDFYKNNIDLKELSPEEKEALFNEFVQHYLGKAFIAEYLSNPLGLLKSIGITIAIGILLLFASEALTIGIAIAGSAYGSIVSALSLRSGLGMLGGANEEKQNAANINDFKIAAKHTAEAMIKIGVNAISLITSLIQFGEACWKGGKLYYKNKKLVTGEIQNPTVSVADKYLTKLNKKSINKLKKRPDCYKILEKYETYFGDNVDFVNELIENTAKKEIYVEPANLLRNYIKKADIFDDSTRITLLSNEEIAFNLLKNMKVSEIHEIFSYKKKLIDDMNNILSKEKFTKETQNWILSIKKGNRPDPKTYLSSSYIEGHLKRFDSGYSYIITEFQYIRYVENSKFLGIPSDGTLFVAPTEYIDELCKAAKSNYNIFEIVLGFDLGYYKNGGGLVRVDIKPNAIFNIRLPSGNEAGVNNCWTPAGFTSGGMPEAITDLIPNTSQYVKITKIKE